VRRTAAADLLLLPSSLGAVALLALNDHLLKGHFAGFWTGKLSDFAGLYFFPFFLLALVVTVWPAAGSNAGSTRSLGVACLLTALVFSAINISPAASGLCERVVTEIWQLFGVARRVHHIADAEDLMALPMALLAYLVGAEHLAHFNTAWPRAGTLRRPCTSRPRRT
jgi:hypothetical protein